MKRGFTLIEFIIVMVILGILSALIIPAVRAMRRQRMEVKQVLVESPVGKEVRVEGTNVFSLVRVEEHGGYTIVVIREGNGVFVNEHAIMHGLNWAVKLR